MVSTAISSCISAVPKEWGKLMDVLLAVSQSLGVGRKISRRTQQLDGLLVAPDQSSSGSVGGLRSLRKYSALRGAAMV
jgi:hypothetical protein